MNQRQTNKIQTVSRRWALAAGSLLLVSSLGCSLAQRLHAPAAQPQQVSVRQLEPTRTPLPTLTATASPSLTPPPTSTPTDTPPATATPLPTTPPVISAPLPAPLPTDTPPPPVAVAAVAPKPVVVAPPTATPPPTDTPTPLPTATPNYTYRAEEMYQDHTSNPFLTGYVAVVNAQEIPIGGVKAVGVFEPGDIHYESPLSEWFFNGATAPGAVEKESSVKFEPPGGIQQGTWTLHLEDPNGTRLSSDWAFATDPQKPEWFYVKFKQPPPTSPAGPAIVAAPPVNPAAPAPVAAVNPLVLPTATVAVAAAAPAPPTAGWAFANIQIINNGDGSETAYGEMINNTGSAQLVDHISGAFFNGQGQPLPTPGDTYGYWPLDVVPAGARVPFQLTAYNTQNVGRVDMTVASQPDSQQPRQNFEISNTAATSDDGAYCVTGTVRNSGAQLHNYLTVVVLLYNDQGQVINFESDQAASPEAIVSGGTFGVDVCLDPLGQHVARFDLRSFGQ
ncbi:MAG: hypothetical protein FOGNACKC_05787 [Anaerolineae bacterium]|nr:hypothetical protein [Anaerolineae bacterium]